MMLENDLAMLRLYRDLGMRQMHLGYNRDNSLAGGCHGSDIPLSRLGRAAVDEINRIGMLMDCSHSGYCISMDIMNLSTRPVIFSHAHVGLSKTIRETSETIKLTPASEPMAL